MPNHSISPVAGADIRRTDPTIKPAQAINLGTVVKAKDGHDYIYAQAGGTQIAANTATVLTEATWRMAAGAGAWTTQDFAVPANHYAWFKRVAI